MLTFWAVVEALRLVAPPYSTGLLPLPEALSCALFGFSLCYAPNIATESFQSHRTRYRDHLGVPGPEQDTIMARLLEMSFDLPPCPVGLGSANTDG